MKLISHEWQYIKDDLGCLDNKIFEILVNNFS